jgi:hypothetical protein
MLPTRVAVEVKTSEIAMSQHWTSIQNLGEKLDDELDIAIRMDKSIWSIRIEEVSKHN